MKCKKRKYPTFCNENDFRCLYPPNGIARRRPVWKTSKLSGQFNVDVNPMGKPSFTISPNADLGIDRLVHGIDVEVCQRDIGLR